MEDEIWKTIEEFPNYAISNKGEVINKKTKRILKSHIDKDGYYKVILSYTKPQKHKFIHRLLANAFVPNPDNLPYVDHIDRDKKNNLLTNLRWVNRTQNNQNTDTRGQSGYKGVFLKKSKFNLKKPYEVYINYNKTRFFVGAFSTPEEAAIAYNKKAYEIYGDNARLNILPDNYYFM